MTQGETGVKYAFCITNMSAPQHHTFAAPAVQRPWDARFARRLVTPLKDSWVSPNHLTTLRLGVGLGAAGAFLPGTYLCSNVAALLLVLSNFLDHTDGELARLSGKTSRFGHLYDLASDAVVTVLLFVAIGLGLGDVPALGSHVSGGLVGAVAGACIALIFYLRLRIEEFAGKVATRQNSLGGFETEDVLYLMPFATLSDGLESLLLAASIGAPLYALWLVCNYRRLMRRPLPASARTSGVAQ